MVDSEGRMEAGISLLEVMISGSWKGWNIGFIGGGLGVLGEWGLLYDCLVLRTAPYSPVNRSIFPAIYKVLPTLRCT